MTWPGPDLYTLRGSAELEVALDSEVTVDAAHAVLGDELQRAFGPRVFDRVVEALTDEGRDPADLAVLVADDELAARVLARLHERMSEDDEGPEPPNTDYVWSTVSELGRGSQAFRRAKRRRAVNARLAEVLPRRRLIAGERDR